jgi:hypothetical protein
VGLCLPFENFTLSPLLYDRSGAERQSPTPLLVVYFFFKIMLKKIVNINCKLHGAIFFWIIHIEGIVSVT